MLSKVGLREKVVIIYSISNIDCSSLCRYVFTRVGIRLETDCETTKTTRVGKKGPGIQWDACDMRAEKGALGVEDPK